MGNWFSVAGGCWIAYGKIINWTRMCGFSNAQAVVASIVGLNHMWHSVGILEGILSFSVHLPRVLKHHAQLWPG